MVDYVKKRPKGRKTNNAVGVKGRSGRKSAKEESDKIIAFQAKKISDAMIVNLATSHVYQAMSNETLNNSLFGQQKVAQAFGLPIYLKNKADKVIFSEKSYDNDQRRRLADRIAKRNRGGE
jgi:hypothetical protein